MLTDEYTFLDNINTGLSYNTAKMKKVPKLFEHFTYIENSW